jgi:hypothetical protein
MSVTTPSSTEEVLASYLSVPDQLTLCNLLNSPLASFQRAFVPLPQQRQSCSAVIVRCSLGVVSVELVPPIFCE